MVQLYFMKLAFFVYFSRYSWKIVDVVYCRPICVTAVLTGAYVDSAQAVIKSPRSEPGLV